MRQTFLTEMSLKMVFYPDVLYEPFYLMSSTSQYLRFFLFLESFVKISNFSQQLAPCSFVNSHSLTRARTLEHFGAQR